MTIINAMRFAAAAALAIGGALWGLSILATGNGAGALAAFFPLGMLAAFIMPDPSTIPTESE